MWGAPSKQQRRHAPFSARNLCRVSAAKFRPREVGRIGHHFVLSIESTALVPLFNDASKEEKNFKDGEWARGGEGGRGGGGGTGATAKRREHLFRLVFCGLKGKQQGKRIHKTHHSKHGRPFS